MIHASGTLGGKFKRRFQSWQLGKPQGLGALSQVRKPSDKGVNSRQIQDPYESACVLLCSEGLHLHRPTSRGRYG
jgi:hypothetical protein